VSPYPTLMLLVGRFRGSARQCWVACVYFLAQPFAGRCRSSAPSRTSRPPTGPVTRRHLMEAIPLPTDSRMSLMQVSWPMGETTGLTLSSRTYGRS